jgi:hypothetical protein
MDLKEFAAAGWRSCIDHLIKPHDPCPICMIEQLTKALDKSTRRSVDLQDKLYTQVRVTGQKLTVMQEEVYRLKLLGEAQRDCIRIQKMGTDCYRDEAAERQDTIDEALILLRQRTPYVNTAICILEGPEDEVSS